MFLDNLSGSLLKLCAAEDLSYERAAELCRCSSRHFANIICKRTYPSLNVFEKICTGFHETPNHLLGVEEGEFSYRLAMPVRELHIFSAMTGEPSFPVCPRCGRSLEREYMDYCDSCGQRLSWEFFKNADVVIRS